MLFFHGLFLCCLLPWLALCAEDYYKLLGVDKQASDRDIKKAYRTLSKKYHPDKNPGDESAKQKFVEIAEAYDALSSPETRRIYDQFGHEGLAQHKQGGARQAANPFDLFSRFFGGSGHFGHAGGERRGPAKEVRVQVPLRDFYTGRETQFSIEKQQICDACEGSGSADGFVDTCERCGGRGMLVQKHMLAPGIFQQMQSACDVCGGKGKTVRHACGVCGGARVVMGQETYNLSVERGVPRGVTIRYENEGDESPDWVAGDLMVTIVELEPKLAVAEDGERTDGTFMRRRGNDLFWVEVLSLREAWMGDWSRNLTHLDGHVVRLGRKRGEVVQPGTVEMIADEGMPIWERDKDQYEEEFGKLHVEYTVVLPDQMEKTMEKDFWEVWGKWRRKTGVDLLQDSGRPTPGHDEL